MIIYHILPLSSIFLVWQSLNLLNEAVKVTIPGLATICSRAQLTSIRSQIQNRLLRPKPCISRIQYYFSEKQRFPRPYPLVEKKFQGTEYEVLSVRRRNQIEIFGIDRKNKVWYICAIEAESRAEKIITKGPFNSSKWPLVNNLVASRCLPPSLPSSASYENRRHFWAQSSPSPIGPVHISLLKSCRQTARCVSVPAYHKFICLLMQLSSSCFC